LLLSRIFDALGQMPTAIGKMRSLENGECGPQPDGGRGFGVFEQTARSFDGEGGEVAHTVTQDGDLFALGIVGGSLEGGVLEPVVNRIAVQARVLGSGSDGAPLSKGGHDLGLRRRQARGGDRGGVRWMVGLHE
jgi:hypothetical protein